MKPDYDPGNPEHVHHDCHRGAGCQVPGEDCQAPDVDPDDELEMDGQELIAEHTGWAVDDRPTLEACICGEHRDCPDGWHSEADMPCSCTPDCALEDDDNEDARALLAEMDGIRPR